MHDIKSICAQVGLTNPRTLIEFGAAHPFSMRLGPYIDAGNKVILVEANPRLYYCITKGWEQGDFQSTWPEVPPLPHAHPGLSGARLQVINAAIVETAGPVTFFEYNASSFVKGVSSPAVVNNGFDINAKQTEYTVPGMTIDQFDDGEIDVLLADVEGSEWWCINGLKSRPKVIVLELWGQTGPGETFENANIGKIAAWMNANGYAFGGRDQTDAVFIKQ